MPADRVMCDKCGKFLGEFPLQHEVARPIVHCLSCSIPNWQAWKKGEAGETAQKSLGLLQEAFEKELGMKAAEGKAKRENISVRYDLLVPEFLHEMARLAGYGAEKYGDTHWKQSRLSGNKSPLNHLHQHLNQFQSGKDHDFFQDKKGHLVSVAFNAMMEWWYESRVEK